MKTLLFLILLVVLIAIVGANTFYMYKLHDFLVSQGELRSRDTFKEKVLQSLESIEDKLRGD